MGNPSPNFGERYYRWKVWLDPHKLSNLRREVENRSIMSHKRVGNKQTWVIIRALTTDELSANMAIIRQHEAAATRPQVAAQRKKWWAKIDAQQMQINKLKEQQGAQGTVINELKEQQGAQGTVINELKE